MALQAFDGSTLVDTISASANSQNGVPPGTPVPYLTLTAADITSVVISTTNNGSGVGFNVSSLTEAQSSSTSSVTTPLPAALPLFATGLVGLVLLGWRRKKAAAG